MKVAIVHYHLEPGGVTRVIENTIQAWKSHGMEIDCVVIAGRKYTGNLIPCTKVVKGLDYMQAPKLADPKGLTEKLETAARQSLGSLPDLWHFHNHSLGKNPAFSLVVSALAEKGYPLLLHPHDFAEDGRPTNFLALKECYESIYPCSPKIHYAVLNHRDFCYMEKMLGEYPSKVHMLANAISKSECQATQSMDSSLPSNLFLYPVRAVRRKNLGELALLSTIYPENHFANSLGSTNPNFLPEFNEWKNFAANQKLNLTYGLGENSNVSFTQMLEHATGVVTTSIAEGFGLGFLEPWTYGKSLCGRNLPEITEDFSNLGIDLENLYERLEVNLDLLEDPKSLLNLIEATVVKFYNDYGATPPVGSNYLAYQSMVKHNRVDFGRLNENLQKQVISKLKFNREASSEVRSQNLLKLVPKATIEKNKSAITQKFSLENYGKKLVSIYHEILNANQEEITYANGKLLLDQFLDPQRLFLLRAQ